VPLSLSIIVPTFNRAALLGRTLASIRAAIANAPAASPVEIIVADDGSSDDTDAVCRRAGVTCLRQANAGPGAARNLGAAAASGEYLAFVDADDLWLPWTLDVATRLIEATDRPAILASMPRAFTRDGEVAGWAEAPPAFDRFPDYLAADPVDIFPGAGCLFVKREAFRAAGGFTTERVGAEDADLYLRLGTAPGFVFVRAPVLVAYRTHLGSFSLDVGAGVAGRWAMLRAERAGRYPGGRARRADRRAIITSHCRSACVVAARDGRVREASVLYAATLLWHLAQTRWRFILGFPALLARAIVRPRRPGASQGFLPAPVASESPPSRPAASPDAAPRAAVIFATRNRKDELRRAIASCLAQTVPLRVIVRDDASDDGTEAMIRAEFPTVDYARHPTPRGSIANRNEAVAAAEGCEIIFSLDDDAAFASPGSAEQTLADFDDPRVGVVAIPFIDVLKGDVVEQAAPSPEGVFVLDTFRGCAAAWRRDAFLAAHGYSPCLRHMAEEPDLALRLLDRGLVVRAGRADPVHHFESPNRDRRHVWKQIARNGVLQGWMTAPWWILPVHLAGTALSAIRVGLGPAPLPAMLAGLFEGLAECLTGGVPRRPVSARAYFLCRWLRRHKPAALSDIEPRLSPVRTSTPSPPPA